MDGSVNGTGMFSFPLRHKGMGPCDTSDVLARQLMEWERRGNRVFVMDPKGELQGVLGNASARGPSLPDVTHGNGGVSPW